jgi:hypothetical protein
MTLVFVFNIECSFKNDNVTCNMVSYDDVSKMMLKGLELTIGAIKLLWKSCPRLHLVSSH